jgi:hypothetical protein
MRSQKEKARMGKCGSHFDLLNLESVNPVNTNYIKLKTTKSNKSKGKKSQVALQKCQITVPKHVKGEPIPIGPFANI